MRYRLAALLLLLAPVPAVAQEGRALPALPADVEDRIEEMRNDPNTVRLSGPVSIPADSVIRGDLVVEGGSLELGGRVDGDVLVTRGDLVLAEGAAIGGDVLVVAGEVTGFEHASVGGTVLTYGAADADGRHARRDKPSRDDDDRDDDDRDDDDWDDGDWDDEGDEHDDHGWRHDHDEGGLDLGLSIAGNYNRVEGLPVMFGPVVRTGGPNRLTISGQAIWRTQPSESLDEEIGYQARLQQGLFGDRLRIGGDVRSMVRAIETRGLNSTEAGLAAALFHSDLHDYYEDESWSVHVELHPASLPIEARLGYRQAEHGVLEVSDPWSLFDRGDDWRPQPVVAEGDVSTLALGVRLDTRDHEDEPTRGFFAAVGAEHALDQELAMPSLDLDGTVVGGGTFDDFTTAYVDLRTYVPVNRSSTLNLRGYAAGTIDETVLPPQFQHAFGGIGTLPGFSLFEGSCGSRSEQAFLVTPDPDGGPNELSEHAMLPSYGCDRIALAQLEYRGGFDLIDVGHDHDDDDADDEDGEGDWNDWHHHDFDLSADWAFFVDVAQGWSYGDLGFADREDTDVMADVGFGLLFDEVGVYGAIPITGDDQSLRVVVRLQRRF